MNEDRISQTAELRQRGLSLRSIAAILGIGKSQVARDLEHWEQDQIQQLLDGTIDTGPPLPDVPSAGQ